MSTSRGSRRTAARLSTWPGAFSLTNGGQGSVRFPTRAARGRLVQDNGGQADVAEFAARAVAAGPAWGGAGRACVRAVNPSEVAKGKATLAHLLCFHALCPCLLCARYLSGEDPVLGSRLGVPLTEGIQTHVMAIAKHYILNNQETDRSGEGGHPNAHNHPVVVTLRFARGFTTRAGPPIIIRQ